MATFTNQATLSYNGNTVNSNIVTGNIVEVLSATKTAVSASYNTGDDITYIISLSNVGNTSFTGITITDNLGEFSFGTGTLVPLDYVEGSALYYQNGILQPAPTVSDTNPLTFTAITVPANGNAMIIYEAKPNSVAPLGTGSTITNQVTVSGSGLSTPLVVNETVSVTDEAVLSITKALSPSDVTENSQLTYTFTIQNTGNAVALATDNLVITDTFNPILSDITVTLNGATLPTTAYTYDETTGIFSIIPGIITVPAASYTQNPVTGEYVITPGITTVTVTGTV